MQIHRFHLRAARLYRAVLLPALILLLAAAAAVRAQNPMPESAVSQDTGADEAGDRRRIVFQANEGILIRIPLDSASVLNGAYPIDSAGYATLPVVGRLYVHGRSAADLESYLGKRMSPYLRDTHILATPVIRLTLLGYWQQPGMHYVDPEASVWEACRQVGGPAGEQNIDKWRVMRGSRDLSISLLDEFSRGSSLRKAGVHSGDIFVIPQPNPQSGFWYWFRETMTVTAQIASIAATGLTVYLTYLTLEERP